MSDQRSTDHSEGRIGQTEIALADLGLYINNPLEVQILTNVHKGMRVFDENGEALGKVEKVQFGDPEAVTVSPIVLQGRLGFRKPSSTAPSRFLATGAESASSKSTAEAGSIST